MDEMKNFFDGLAPSWDEGLECEGEALKPYLDLLPIKKTDFVLDVGCGTGVISGLLGERVKEVLGIDLSPKMLEIAKKKHCDKKNVSFVCDDFVRMPIDKNADFIVLYNCYPHFLDRELLAKKIASSLNEGGRFAVLHSLSRQELNGNTHGGLPFTVSSSLQPLEVESRYFMDAGLTITNAKEGEHLYLILGKK